MKNRVCKSIFYATNFILYIGVTDNAIADKSDNIIDFTNYPQGISFLISDGLGNKAYQDDYLFLSNMSAVFEFWGINSSSDNSQSASQTPNCPSNTPTSEGFMSIVNTNPPLEYKMGEYGKKWKILTGMYNSKFPVCGSVRQQCKAPNKYWWMNFIFSI
ncbi:TPA: hypothetical protein ACRR2I_003888 [Providencia rettgeri]